MISIALILIFLLSSLIENTDNPSIFLICLASIIICLSYILFDIQDDVIFVDFGPVIFTGFPNRY